MRDLSFYNLLHGFTQPLETWSQLHRISAAIAIAGLAYIASSYLWQGVQTVSDATRHSELAKLNSRVQVAEASLAALPALRQRVKKLNAKPNIDESWLDDVHLWQTLATTAVSNGLVFEQFAPNPITSYTDWRERALKLQISGSFSNLTNFVAYLAALPFPVIPISAQLQAQKNGTLSLDAVLRVIGTPHQIKMPANIGTELAEWPNPFQTERAALLNSASHSFALTPWQLAGVLQQGAVRAALLQSANSFLLVKVGDWVDDAVVTRIEDKSLLLTYKQGSRTLLLKK